MNTIALGRKLAESVKAVNNAAVTVDTLKSQHEGVASRIDNIEELVRRMDERQIELIELIKKALGGPRGNK